MDIKKSIRHKFGFIPVLDRWLLGELFQPLIFSISVFTVLCLSLGEILYVIRMISEAGLNIKSAFEVLIFSLPSYIVISFPMATLLASLLTYSKLSSNSEIKALYTVGYTKRRVIVPALILGLIMSFTTFIFNDLLVPQSNLMAELSLRKGLGQSLDIGYKKDIVYSKFNSNKKISNIRKLNQLFHAEEFNNNQMLNVTLVEHLEGEDKRIIVAKRARLNSSEDTWDLIEGQILTLSKNKTLSKESFDHYEYKLNSGPLKIARLPSDSNNMTVSQALKARNLYKESGNIKEVRRMKVRIQEKFTFPIACFIFSLIGVNVALIVKYNTNQSQMFGLSIILILVYYLISFMFSSLGVSGTLNSFIASWAPVLISIYCGELLIEKES